MKILAFYSFKGGVGRSLSLANIAYLLSRKYKMRVGLLDLDIESSGLHHILNIKVPTDGDLLNLLLPRNRDIVRLENYVYSIPQFVGSGANIYLLPTLSNVTLLQQIEWDATVDLFIRDQLLPTFENLYELDYLLIDGRTGLSKFSALALMQAELVLLFSRLDRQNQYGISRMVKVCNEAGKSFLNIVSNCPQIRGYKTKIAKFEEIINSKVDCILPYFGNLYFDEFLVCDELPESRLAKAYQALAKLVIEHDYEDD